MTKYNDNKILAVQNAYSTNKYSYRELGEIFQVHHSTIERWVNNKFPKKEKKEHVDPNILKQTIKSIIDNNKFITLSQIVTTIFNKYNYKYPKKVIANIIHKDLNYSYKKINKKKRNIKLQNFTTKQRDFLLAITQINRNDIVSIDETGIYSNYTTNYGWGPKNIPLVDVTGANPTKYNILLAITNKEILKFEHHKQSINKDIFVKFMKKLDSMVTNKVFLMDNVPFHHSTAVTDIFINSTNRIMYTPPYSPEFNPIEEVFSQIKRNTIKFNYKNIITRVKKSINLIKPEHLENYFNHSFNRNINDYA